MVMRLTAASGRSLRPDISTPVAFRYPHATSDRAGGGFSMTFDQNRLWGFAVLLSLVSPAAAQTIPAVDLQPFLRKDSYERIKISPTGDYYAATVPLADRTILVVIRRSDQTPTAKTEDREDTVIADFWWVSENRIMAGMAKKYGCNDTPLATGELFAVDVDGGRSRWLAGPTDYSYA